MSLEIFPTRRVAIEEIADLSAPWKFAKWPTDWLKKSGWLVLPKVARALAWVASDEKADGTVVRPFYAPGAVWFEIYSTNLQDDRCGPFFEELGKLLGCQFVEMYGSVVTREKGVDSEVYDDGLVNEALRAMERRAGLLKHLYDRPKDGWTP